MIFDSNIIEFYCDPDLYGVLPEPKLASKCVPDWFKRVKPHTPNREPGGFKGLSVKKCLPVLDAMSLGYIIPLQGDIHIVSNHDLSVIKAHEKQGAHQIVDKHPYIQVNSEAWPGFKQDPLKFINHWHIKTKPGWSCYFCAPVNHFGSPFTCISGVVDTDKYPQTINFPALWNVPNYDDTIPAGTPLVQVIPFKREKMVEPKVRPWTKKEKKAKDTIARAQRSRDGVYTQELREKR